MARQNIYIIVATFNDKHILRFVVCSRMTESKDVQFAWEEIRGQADQVLMGNDTEWHPGARPQDIQSHEL
jgi:hypothetical protein